MQLETIVENEKAIKPESSFLPYASKYLEQPDTEGYDSIHAYTSITFCTFKGIPLTDDGD